MQNHALAYAYWSQPIDTLLADLRSAPDGLSAAAARERLAELRPNLRNGLVARKEAVPVCEDFSTAQ